MPLPIVAWFVVGARNWRNLQKIETKTRQVARIAQPRGHAVFGLSRKIAAAFLAAAIASVAMMGLVFDRSTRLSLELETMRAAASTLRQQMTADMGHDALRADVYAALYNRGGDAARTRATKGVEEHGRSLRDAAKAIASNATRPDIVTAVRDIMPALDAYAASAEAIVTRAFGDRAAAEAELPAFEKRFGELEQALAALGDIIETESSRAEDAANVERGRGLLISALCTAGVLLMLVIGYLWMNRSVLRPLRVLTSVLDGKGETEALATIAARHASDEIGRLSGSMAAFIGGSTEAARIRSALDGCPSKVMVVDNDNRIVYANAAVSALFREHLADFRKTLPGFDPASVVGQNMGVFHRNAAHQERMVQALSGVHNAKVRIGARTFNLAVSPVLSPTGERLGAMLEWRDLTDELVLQDELKRVADAAAAGDFSQRLPVADKTGFMREMADAMNGLSEMMESATAEFARVMGAVAQGDLTETVASAYGGKLGTLKDALNHTVERLADTVATIQATAVDVATAAGQISSGADDLSQRTEQQASSLEETAATAEELSASVKASAQSSREAVQLAEEAMTVAETGGAIVSEAIQAMARIEQASRKITDITSVIDDIAFQTNLLALNAAVEAARAGEAGKGFAVVASEVRTLAQRSSEAAKDISGLITSSTTEVAQGVQLVRSAGDALDKIVGASKRVTTTVSDISAASAEQASGIGEVSQAVAHMDEMTQQNAALAEESAASALSLSKHIERLNALVDAFRTGQGNRAALGAPPVGTVAERAIRADARRLREMAAEAFPTPSRDERPRQTRPLLKRAAARADGWDEF
jgi:methyl-accepting chemotaxis protein